MVLKSFCRSLLVFVVPGIILVTAGCGGSSSPASSHADRPPDFAIYDPAYLKDVAAADNVPSGTTVKFPISLLSENGWKQPVTVQIANLPPGWSAAFASTTYPSLPVGVTTDTLTISAPSIAIQYSTFPGTFLVSATSGGVTRKLNDLRYIDGFQGNPSNTGEFNVRVAGLSIPRNFSSGNNALAITPPLTDKTGTGGVQLYGAGINGPVSLSLTNNNPGFTVSLDKTTVTPQSDGTLLSASPTITFHASASLDHGAYPITITATDVKDGYSVQSTLYLDVCSVSQDGGPPSLNLPDHQVGTTASTTFGETIEGYPGQVINVSTNLLSFLKQGIPSGVSVQASPATVTLPASGIIDQQVQLTATVTGQVAAGSYPNCVVGNTFLDDPILTTESFFTLNVQ